MTIKDVHIQVGVLSWIRDKVESKAALFFCAEETDSKKEVGRRYVLTLWSGAHKGHRYGHAHVYRECLHWILTTKDFVGSVCLRRLCSTSPNKAAIELIQ